MKELMKDPKKYASARLIAASSHGGSGMSSEIVSGRTDIKAATTIPDIHNIISTPKLPRIGEAVFGQILVNNLCCFKLTHYIEAVTGFPPTSPGKHEQKMEI